MIHSDKTATMGVDSARYKKEGRGNHGDCIIRQVNSENVNRVFML